MLDQCDLDHVLGLVDWEDLRGQRIFITGGTGFVGKWLLETLAYAQLKLKIGAEVMVLTRDPELFRREHPYLAYSIGVTLIQGAPESFDYPDGVFPFVIHAAAEHPARTLHVLEFARTHGCRRFLYTSSGAVYGKQMVRLSSEEDKLPDWASEYGCMKRASEQLCLAGQRYGFDAMIARLFAFSGPYLPLDKHYAVGNFIRDTIAGMPIWVKGDGTPRRSYLYAADLAVWLWTILLKGESGRPYNVGSPHSVLIAEVAWTASYLAGGVPIVYGAEPVPGAEPERYVPSTERAEKEIGLKVHIELEEGMRRMYEHAKSQALTHA